MSVCSKQIGLPEVGKVYAVNQVNIISPMCSLHSSIYILCVIIKMTQLTNRLTLWTDKAVKIVDIQP